MCVYEIMIVTNFKVLHIIDYCFFVYSFASEHNPVRWVLSCHPIEEEIKVKLVAQVYPTNSWQPDYKPLTLFLCLPRLDSQGQRLAKGNIEADIWPTVYFCKSNFIGIQPYCVLFVCCSPGLQHSRLTL